MKYDSILGIDIAKEKFDVHLYYIGERASGQFENNLKGFQQLERWLDKRAIGRLHACMEATGSYGEGLARFLYETIAKISVMNPIVIKHYGKMKMQRNKTDKLDARLICEYCRSEEPRAWAPPPEEQALLKALTRRLEAMKEDRAREKNRLKAQQHPVVIQQSIEATIDFYTEQIAALEKQINDHIDNHPETLKKTHRLLTSIQGIADKSAAIIMAELPDLTLFRSAKQVTAYAGLTPKQLQSGQMMRKGGLYKLGSSRLRRALFYPAMTGKRHNPILKAMAERLAERGLTGMPMIAALMRKLLVLVYGVMKTGLDFDPNFATTA